MKTMFGSNRLIVNGEKCVRNAKDILKYYERSVREEDAPRVKIAEELMPVYHCINRKGKRIDELCLELNMPAHKVMTALTLLEMQGHIFQHSGGIFSK
ncbi:MAG: hypothetical protein IJ215_01725 [Clostridia bacterium]|nr:hypothetical protein [Clostridia bacterium]